MKVTIDLEDLAALTQQAINENFNAALQKAVELNIQKELEENGLQARIKDSVDEKLAKIVDDYLEKETVIIGGGFYDSTPRREITITEFVKEELTKHLQNHTVETGRGYDKKKYTIEEYILYKLDVDHRINASIEAFANSLKHQIDTNIQNTFNDNMKNVLADNVLKVLQSQDTFTTIMKNVGCIAYDKNR